MWGKTRTELCPVKAMLDYLIAQGSRRGLLFQFTDRKTLTRAYFVVRVRQALKEAGVDSSLYSGHSFCIGVAMANLPKSHEQACLSSTMLLFGIGEGTRTDR